MSCFRCRQDLWPSHDFVLKTPEGTKTIEPVACFNPDCPDFTIEYQQEGNSLYRLNRAFEGMTVADIVKEMGIGLDSTIDLDALVEEALTKFPNQTATHRSGKKDLSGFFVGQIMKTEKSVDPKVLRETILKALA